jgi:hypothetical protein
VCVAGTLGAWGSAASTRWPSTSRTLGQQIPSTTASTSPTRPSRAVSSVASVRSEWSLRRRRGWFGLPLCARTACSIAPRRPSPLPGTRGQSLWCGPVCLLRWQHIWGGDGAGCLPLSVSPLALAALASFRRVVALSLPVAYILLVRRASGHAGILISAGFELVKPGDEASPEGEVRSRMLCFTRSTRPDTRTSSTHTRACSTHTSHTHTYIARNSSVADGRCRVRPLSNRSQVIGCSRKWRTNALPQSRRFLRAPSEAPGSSNTTVRPAEAGSGGGDCWRTV